MTAEGPADRECLFCQIVAGTRPAEIVLESPATIAFLDRFPAARGHTLVVPRQHAATVPELDDGSAGALFGAVVEVVEQLTASLHPAGFNVGWNHGAAAGQHVFHVHVHVLPRFQDGGCGVQAAGEGYSGADMAELAEVIRGGRAKPTAGGGRASALSLLDRIAPCRHDRTSRPAGGACAASTGTRCSSSSRSPGSSRSSAPPRRWRWTRRR